MVVYFLLLFFFMLVVGAVWMRVRDRRITNQHFENVELSKYHSQEKQDQFLEQHVFQGMTGGIFVDVGAHDGISLNNTLFFERERQWTGFNFEPNPQVFQELQRNRPRCRNLPYAVSSKEQQGVAFLIQEGVEMLSGLSDHYDPRHHKRAVEEGANTRVHHVDTKRLDSVLRTHGVTRVHYLSIDVEGAEMEVIQSIDFAEIFVDVIGFEANYPEQAKTIQEYLEKRDFKRIVHPAAPNVDIFMVHKSSPFAAKFI